MTRILTLIMVCLLSTQLFAQETIDLCGPWDVSTGDTQSYDNYVILPGSFLDRKADVKNVGQKAWYRKDFYLPQSWEYQHVVLFLERPGAATKICVNGVNAGQQQWTTTPHQYNVTPCLKFGGRNKIEIYSEGTFEGKMELRAQPDGLYLEQVRLQPKPFKGEVEVELELGGMASIFSRDFVVLMVKRENVEKADVYERYFDVTGNHMKVSVPVGDMIALWDEFTPNLYRIGIRVGEDYYETTFGMREFTAEGRQLMTNQRPFSIRGTLERAYPVMDEAAWNKVLKPMKEYGLNFVRFQDYCPPEDAFAAADKLGLYLQPAGPHWPDSLEAERIRETYGNHPSFAMIDLGDSLQLLKKAEGEVSKVAFYKQEIEQVLRSDHSAGFLLPGFADCTKGTTAEAWREFCSPVLPLAVFPKQTYTTAETLSVPVVAYNAMYGNIDSIRSTFYITDEKENILCGGQLSHKKLILGRCEALGTVVLPLHIVKAPGKYTLQVQIGKTVKNRWDFQVVPQPEEIQTTEKIQSSKEILSSEDKTTQ